MSARKTLRRCWGASGVAAALLLPAAVSAATLSSATFTYQLQGLPKKIFTGAGVTGAATSQLSAHVDGGTGFNGAITTFIPTTAAPPITAFQVLVTKNGSGSFTGVAPGQVGGTLEVDGVANVYGPGWPTLPLLSVPLQLGVPNTIVQEGGGVSITAIAAGWTVGTVSVATTFGTPTRMGSNALTPGGAGTLVLVTPQLIRTNVAGVLAAFGTLSLTYVPEPGTLLLLGLGVACVAAVGRRRM